MTNGFVEIDPRKFLEQLQRRGVNGRSIRLVAELLATMIEQDIWSRRAKIDSLEETLGRLGIIPHRLHPGDPLPTHEDHCYPDIPGEPLEA